VDGAVTCVASIVISFVGLGWACFAVAATERARRTYLAERRRLTAIIEAIEQERTV
jgi:hypothetical protein